MPRNQVISVKQSSLGGLIYDWSYQFVDESALEAFASEKLPSDFEEKRGLLIKGLYQNVSEGRAVSHVLNRASDSVLRTGHDAKFAKIVRKLRSGNWLGSTGKPIKDIVNIGVGGSDLGPLMTSFALKEFSSDIQNHDVETHFVSSMDGGQLYAVLPIVDPETTVFIIASKSFGTLDTFANVDSVKVWVEEHFNKIDKSIDDWFAHHVIGVSANVSRMTELGIPPAHQLTFSQSVGGRFSMWSSIGLSIATTCGVKVFERLLAGARLMDEHFANAPLLENIPMIMALCGVYNREVREINNLAVLPYDGRFRHLPSYLQQLDMESNGKQCTANGEKISQPTGPIIWGGFGPNGQHAFFQHLHQGYDKFAADFLLVLKRKAPGFSKNVQESLADQQELSVANCLAHRKLMAYGSDDGTARNFYPGGHPSNLIALKELTPESFGAIIAAYEHKVFTQGIIWNLNSFDQPGVELGKKIAVQTLAAIQNKSDESFDESTDSFIRLTRE